MTIIFVRHGETALNASRVLQPPDTPLSARGLLQAAAVAQRLVGMAPAAIVSSDMPRAMQTAEAIARATGLAITGTALLHERNFGALRGKPYDHLGYDPLRMLDAPEGGESWAQFQQRTQDGFAFVVQQRGLHPGPLVVVAHGLVIGALLGSLPLAPGLVLPVRIGNTSITVAAALAPHEVSLVNSMLHLDGAVAEDGSSLSGG